MKKYLNRPMNILLVYLLLTIVAFIVMYYGQSEGQWLTVVYALLCTLALFLGYQVTFRKKSLKAGKVHLKSLNAIVVVFSIALVITSMVNVFSLYPNVSTIFYYLSRPGEAYEYTKWLNKYGPVGMISLSSSIGISVNCLTFSKYAVPGFSYYYWSQLKRSGKLFAVTSMVIYVIHAFLIGAMVNIGLFAISVLPFIWVKSYTRLNFAKSDTSLLRKAGSAIALCAVILLLAFFLGSRNVFGSGDNVLLSGLEGLLFYISHGYQGLTYCLQLPFHFTEGTTVFHGFATTIFPMLGIENQFSLSYLVRSEQMFGWGALRVWSTIYPWIASDTTFYLVPFVMFAIGVGARGVWCSALSTQNPLAMLLFGQFLIFGFMIPANNQLFHTFGNGVGFVIIFILYMYSTRRKDREHHCAQQNYTSNNLKEAKDV